MTIKGKLLSAFASIIFIIIVTGFYIYNSINNLNQLSYEKTERYNQILKIDELRLISTKITLVAMDSIIDRDAGEIDKERIDDIYSLFKNVFESE